MDTSYKEVPPTVNPLNNTTIQPTKTSCANSGFAIAPDISGGKTRITCPPLVVRGLDFLKISFWLEWHTPTLFQEC